jgi:hypothetical protein
MNDGVARMSNALAKQIADVLGLDDTPAGYQGRIGSAKGFWIKDVTDDGSNGDIWIEIYPSQRKWTCDFDDEAHRTFEVKMYARPLSVSRINKQLIPILENRAKDANLMRKTLKNHLIKTLGEDLLEQLLAMEQPIQLRQRVHSHAKGRYDRHQYGQVTFLAGLPERDEEVINFLLDGGFNPKKQKYLQDIVIHLAEKRCDELKEDLKIVVGRSTSAYMVVDFWGYLDEGEVHMGFSNKFQTEGFSEVLLHGMDVLVARNPAHFVSDIQRVKAVFRPELSALKDVIVFSSKGNTPLADMLSGGDYDGDIAWVCWDPDIVSNFQTAPIPSTPDLSNYLGKDKQTFQDLLTEHTRNGGRDPIQRFIYKSFVFNMQRSFLGICTNYKRLLCYKNNEINDAPAILLSTLVGTLVDQAKQGIIFREEDWRRLQKERISEVFHLEEPAYSGGSYSGSQMQTHILDYLKFEVAGKTIDSELARFHTQLKRDGEANIWDPDLAAMYKYYRTIAKSSKTIQKVMESLVVDIRKVEIKWKKQLAAYGSKAASDSRINIIHDRWLAIQPRIGNTSVDSSRINQLLYSHGRGASEWDLLKASATFMLCYKCAPKFVWRIGGRQLQWIKVQRCTTSRDSAVVAVTPTMWAISRPDNKIVTLLSARVDASGYAEIVAAGEDAAEDEKY